MALLTEVKKKKKDEAEIKEKMQHTFSIRRHEVLQEPPVPEFQSRWPALFDVSEVSVITWSINDLLYKLLKCLFCLLTFTD